jgi:metal-responsive CopG/Arc/MetJ family transcriptional regulator
MMKAIQITIDEQLLRAFDKDPEVRARGRSATLRRLLAEYLKGNRRAAIAQAYRRGYGKAGAPELHGWAAEGQWPEE